VGTLAQTIALTFALGSAPIAPAESVRAIASPDGAWAITHRGSLWICWRHDPGKPCLRRVAVVDDNETGTPANFRRGKFFSADTFVVATSIHSYVVRRGENLASPIGPDDQPHDLDPFRAMTCSPTGWLPVRRTSGFHWLYKPCRQQVRLHCPGRPSTRRRRPTGMRLKLSIEGGRKVRHALGLRQVSSYFAITFDLGFSPRPSISLSRARLRRAQARPKSIALSSTIPELQAREAHALRDVLCRPDQNK